MKNAAKKLADDPACDHRANRFGSGSDRGQCAVGRRQAILADERWHRAEHCGVGENKRCCCDKRGDEHLGNGQYTEEVGDGNRGHCQALDDVAAEDQPSAIAPIGEGPSDQPEAQIRHHPRRRDEPSECRRIGHLKDEHRQHDDGDRRAEE
jgi:hypothetical protein